MLRRTSRELTAEEADKFKEITSPEKMEDFVNKKEGEKEARSRSEETRSQRHEVRKNKDGTTSTVEKSSWEGGWGGNDMISVETEDEIVKARVGKQVKDEKDVKEMTINPNPDGPKVSGSQLGARDVKLIAEHIGLSEEDLKDVKVKDGAVSNKDVHNFPKLPGVDEKDAGSKSVGSAIQVLLYVKARKAGMGHEEALKAASGTQGLAAAGDLLKSLTGPKVVASEPLLDAA